VTKLLFYIFAGSFLFVFGIMGAAMLGSSPDKYDEGQKDWLNGECQLQSVTTFEGWCTYDDYYGEGSIEYFGVNMHVLMSSSDTRLDENITGVPVVANLFARYVE
jgi:hypothetical protein